MIRLIEFGGIVMNKNLLYEAILYGWGVACEECWVENFKERCPIYKLTGMCNWNDESEEQY